MVLKQIAQCRPPLLLITVWGALSGVALWQVLIEPEPLMTGIFELSVPLLLLLPIAYAVKYIHKSERAATHQSRILLITLLFVVTNISMIFIVHLSVPADSISISDLRFPIATGAAAGAGLGSLMGVSYSQTQESRRELETEAERSNRLNQRLSVINRVLRHNVRNKLTLVFSRIDQVTMKTDDPSSATQLRQAQSALEELHSSTESALQVEYLRKDQAEIVVSDLGPMLTRVCEGAREKTPTVTIDVSMPSRVCIRAHPLLPVALEELIENAIKHNTVEDLVVEVTVNKRENRAIITVADNGCGIPATEIEALHLDEEKPLQHTSGVGLWVVKWVTEASNGDWEIRPTDDGTTVTLQIPCE